LFTETATKEETAVERELPQGTLQDLVRGMTIFINKTGIDKIKLNELQDFVLSYKLAQQIHQLHVELEVSAHPDFQVPFSSFFPFSLISSYHLHRGK
jgi:hypothetical protein